MLKKKLSGSSSETTSFFKIFQIKKTFRFRRGALAPYSSYMVAMIRKMIFLPLYILDIWQETVTVNLNVFDHLMLSYYDRDVHLMRVEFQHVYMQISTSRLKLNANLKGVRYFLYYWPLITSWVIFCCAALSLSVTSFFYWLVRCVAAAMNFLSFCSDKQLYAFDVQNYPTQTYSRRRNVRFAGNVPAVDWPTSSTSGGQRR